MEIIISLVKYFKYFTFDAVISFISAPGASLLSYLTDDVNACRFLRVCHHKYIENQQLCLKSTPIH